MLCENCHQQPATVHLTTIVGGEKTEQHLCAACCTKHKQALTMAGMSTLLFNLLQGATASSASEQQDIRCDTCGQTFEEFQKTGMLGCPKCYESFRTQLTPLLTRIHGNTRHTGRAPSRTEEQSHLRRRMDSLKREMDRAVADEDFELAAQLRDELRAMTPAQSASPEPAPCAGGTCSEGEDHA